MEALPAGSPERLKFEVFVLPELKPHLPVPSLYEERPVASFLDANQEEVRIGIATVNGEEWAWYLKRFTEGPDGLWYPVAGVSRTLYHREAYLRAFAAVAERNGQSTHTTRISDPVARVGVAGNGNWEVFALTPSRGGLLVSLQRWEPTGSGGRILKHSTDFELPLSDLPKLIAGFYLLGPAIDKLYQEAAETGRLVEPAPGETYGQTIVADKYTGEEWVPA